MLGPRGELGLAGARETREEGGPDHRGTDGGESECAFSRAFIRFLESCRHCGSDAESRAGKQRH